MQLFYLLAHVVQKLFVFFCLLHKIKKQRSSAIATATQHFKKVKHTIHGVDGLKGHDLRFGRVGLLQHLAEMGHVVVAENEFLSAAVLDALDHRGMVACIRVDLTA